MVCLCGRTISDNVKSLYDRSSQTITLQHWLDFPTNTLYNDMFAYNTFRRMKESLIAAPDGVLELLRLRFAGVLDQVSVGIDGEERRFADFLTAEGVLQQVDNGGHYSMASAFVDGFIRTRVLPAKYPHAPTQYPPTQKDSKALHVFDLVTEALRFFERTLVPLAPSRSYKTSKVRVGGRLQVPVPRENVYDNELVRIFVNWLSKFGWTVTGQWHLQTPSGLHKYTDIVLETSGQRIVLELLATGDPAFVQSHIDKTPEYSTLLSANEGWVIHFAREDDYKPLWQSDMMLNNRIKVMHISHDLDFTRVSVQARWKDIGGVIQNDVRHLTF